MPAWLIAALALLASGAVPGITGQGIPLVPAILDPFEPTGVSIFAGGGGSARPGSAAFVAGRRGRHPSVHEHVHRRRRRKALTNSDMAAIAFIAGTVSKAAAGSFAVQLAARS